MIERIALNLIKFTEKITLGHHDQGIILVIALIIAIFFKSFSMAFAFIGYFLMHLCYGGRGTFQEPIMDNKKPGFGDILIISLGTLCLILYATLALIIIVLNVCKIFGIDFGFTIF